MDEIDQAELEAAAEMDAYAQATEEADEATLDEVKAAALELYREALKDWTPNRGMAAGTGFHTERSWE